MIHRVDAEINRIIQELMKDQTTDGSWNYPFETGIVTDCYTIILLRTLEIDDEGLIMSLVERISSKQEADGSWKLFYDEQAGNLTLTVEAYYALLYSGYRNLRDPRMEKARLFIAAGGGLSKTNIITKTMLALTGQYKWSELPSLPIEVILLPNALPINFFDLSVFARANLAPLLILSDSGFSMQSKWTPDLSHLKNGRSPEAPFLTEHPIFAPIAQGIQSLAGLPEELHALAVNKTEQYMIRRIESDGTFECYFSSTFLMIFALLARGYEKKHPFIVNAVSGIKSMITPIDGHLHVQYTTANVWNTALISDALQEAGTPYDSEVVQRAARYLLSRQQTKCGDWAIHNPHSAPGGWGFSDSNTINPDVDDTTAALRSFASLASSQDRFRQAWDSGIQWVVPMQNHDGGWPAFEKNVDKQLLTVLPIDKGEDLLIDPSSPDLTGRTLEFFGHFTDLNIDHVIIKDGIQWLLNNQKEDGSWDARWGIDYIYGTWAALTGMLAVGVPAEHPSIQKAVEWLSAAQQPDGGWGESCRSDVIKHYVPLGSSTRTHTAWALDALIAASKTVTPQIERGVKFLIDSKEEAWTKTYPKGRGMAGAFYIHYHSYDYIWPLLTLVHYKKKFG